MSYCCSNLLIFNTILKLELEGNIPKKAFIQSNSAQDTDTPPSSDFSDADSMSGSDSESDSETSLSVAKKKSVLYFSKEKPYTFEIEGRCSRNVHIRICGTRMGFGSSNAKLLDGFEEFVQGAIVIHEAKNSEVSHRCFLFSIITFDLLFNQSIVFLSRHFVYFLLEHNVRVAGRQANKLFCRSGSRPSEFRRCCLSI